MSKLSTYLDNIIFMLMILPFLLPMLVFLVAGVAAIVYLAFQAIRP